MGDKQYTLESLRFKRDRCSDEIARLQGVRDDHYSKLDELVAKIKKLRAKVSCVQDAIITLEALEGDE